MKGIIRIEKDYNFENLEQFQEIQKQLSEKDIVHKIYYLATQDDWNETEKSINKMEKNLYNLMFGIFITYYWICLYFVIFGTLQWLVLLIPPIWALAIPLLTIKIKNGKYIGYSEKYLKLYKNNNLDKFLKDFNK